jgi:outer membrane protein assembly factor BamB
LLWEAPLPPGGAKAEYYSSPVVAWGKAYVHVYPMVEGADPKKPRQDEMILCVSMNDGKELWKARFAAEGGKSHNTPCVCDGRLYFAIKTTAGATAVCLDAGSGNEVWKTEFAKGRGPDCTPSMAIVGDKVVVLATKLYGLDVKSGKKEWETDALAEPKTKSWMEVASPAVWEKAGKAHAIVGGSKLTCVAGADGKVLWQMPGSKAPTSPVVVGDTLVVRFPEGELSLYRLNGSGTEKVASAKLEAFDDASWEASTPAFDGRHVYGTCKKQTFCYDLEKKSMVWADKLIGDAIASPVVGDGKMICCDGKKVICLNATDGKVLWQGPWTKAGCGSIALADGRLVVNVGTYLRCYDLRKP